MQYSTIIFDLDGTLLDTSEGIMRGACYTATIMGAPELTIEQQKSFIGPPIIDSFMRECNFSRNRAKEAVEIYRKRYKEKGLYEAKHYNLVKELLVSLNKINARTAVATLKRDDFAKAILKHFDLYKYFNVIKGIDDKDTHTKSDIISMCIEELEEDDLSKVVLIGDSIYDAIGAEQIGIDFIAVTYGYGFKDKNDARGYASVYIADKVEEILKFLKL